jgi:hypothetical protein
LPTPILKHLIYLFAGHEFAPVKLRDAVLHTRDLFLRELRLGGELLLQSSHNSFADEVILAAPKTDRGLLKFGVQLIGNLDAGHEELLFRKVYLHRC